MLVLNSATKGQMGEFLIPKNTNLRVHLVEHRHVYLRKLKQSSTKATLSSMFASFAKFIPLA
jgi:hypothetical protein